MRKGERAAVKAKFGGRCAYCGEPLPERWHVDHLEPVMRDIIHVPGRGFVSGEMQRPERHVASNLMPACPPCNIDKHSMSLEAWRTKLARTCEVLRRHNPTYRHGVRFGLIAETGAQVTFYFERLQEATDGGR